MGRPDDQPLTAMARDQSLRRQVLVGVDGGGSKTDCVVLDAQTKELLGRSAGGASNWYSRDSNDWSCALAALCAFTNST